MRHPDTGKWIHEDSNGTDLADYPHFCECGYEGDVDCARCESHLCDKHRIVIAPHQFLCPSCFPDWQREYFADSGPRTFVANDLEALEKVNGADLSQLLNVLTEGK